ncbi:hypothetical protein Scep_001597 [Stephania cephalantha]|uniref:Uncharacterized protein n=1 Tax=Stephania cephalantha TaxID=152367 RepID=A0AAP0Q7W9_9MAGN
MNAATLKSVEFDEFSIVDEHLSEPEETQEFSSHEPYITITHMQLRKKLESIQKGWRSRR